MVSLLPVLISLIHWPRCSLRSLWKIKIWRKKKRKSECGIPLLKTCIRREHFSLGEPRQHRDGLGAKGSRDYNIYFCISAFLLSWCREALSVQKKRWPPATLDSYPNSSPRGKKLPLSLARKAPRMDLFARFLSLAHHRRTETMNDSARVMLVPLWWDKCSLLLERQNSNSHIKSLQGFLFL